MSQEQYQQILRKTMMLEKHDRRKRDFNLDQEINELKLQRNRDAEDIRLLRVEMQKIQQLFRKYVRLGGLDFLQQRLVPPLLMPERFLNYLEQKRTAMQYGHQ